jgi:hypothetical protein
MRIFQNSGIYPSYVPRLNELTEGCYSFRETREAFLRDRFGACHFLKPILDGDPDAFFTNGDDLSLQRRWADEQGLPNLVSPEEILLAQIEHHQSEVFYNLDPVRFSSSFIKKLPGCVKKSIGWRAAPSPGSDFSAYDLIVNNFPEILKDWDDLGWRTHFFSPAHDPCMDKYAESQERSIDILFVGGYTRHHKKRAIMLEMVAMLADQFNIVYCLDSSRLTKLAESPVGKLLPLGTSRRPKIIQKISRAPVFGLDLYRLLSQTRIVLNGAIDMAGSERGNMRCFEAMGCGALLLSDEGTYPQGMVNGHTLVTYTDLKSLLKKIPSLISDQSDRLGIAQQGYAMISTIYSKSEQWKNFQNLL